MAATHVTWSRQSEYQHRIKLTLAAALVLLGCGPTEDPHTAANANGTECVACHRSDFEAATQPLHVQQLPLQCETCHTQDRWAPARGSNHADFFPLLGAHGDQGCANCHQGTFQIGFVGNQCVDCHAADFDRAARPPHQGLSTDCAQCHSEERSFSSSTFVHPWPREGQHAGETCTNCHGDPPQYAGTDQRCVACHQNDYDRAANPSHEGFSTECQTCHSPAGWTGVDLSMSSTFEHSWPLVGNHGTATCTDCHGDPPEYLTTPTACFDCHRADYERAKSPSHEGFSRDCSSCHTAHGWAGAPLTDPDFSHPWPLVGHHEMAQCSGCHLGDPARYAGTPRECVECHLMDYQTATTPDHMDFSTTCNNCHSPHGWEGADPSADPNFVHPWTLVGSHNMAACTSCHTGDPPQYAGLSRDCAGCHMGDYAAATSPSHSGFPTDCVSCHTPNGWSGADAAGNPAFVHSWPLVGNHTSATCTGCHGTPLAFDITSECVDCHRADYDGAANPKHDGFSTDCNNCHTPHGWPGADPSADPNFVHPWPLVGNHDMAPCTSCHVGNPRVYAGTPQQCVDCHRADYDNAQNPDHSNLSTACNNCHTPHGWPGADPSADPNFVHPWPLTGSHGLAPCTGCHTGNPRQYSGTSKVCVDCHRSDYDSAQNPDHMGFSTTCENCHTTSAWQGANFNDPSFVHPWPLTGNHSSAACGSCHTGTPPQYKGTPQACVDCHRSDYDGAQNPKHDRLSTDCALCHTPSGWPGADPTKDPNFVHPWALTGTHGTAPCAGCHGTPPQYTGTSQVCVDCHRSEYDNANNPDHTNFSTACNNCHTPHGWPGADPTQDPNFVHSWPLVGNHGVAACADCHGTPPQYTGISQVCVDCHRADYVGATNPDHASFSTDCARCHAPTGWQGASVTDPNFVHPWPLNGAHSAAPCSGCHVGNPTMYTGTPRDCVACHQQDRDAATNPDHAGFSNDCSSCHTEVAFLPSTFVHPWSLTGQHVSAPCNGCHIGSPPRYAGTPQQCVDCHRSAYNNATNPSHAGVSTDCTNCHMTSGWRPATGGTHPENRFPTGGRHNYQCNECHNPNLGANGRGNADCVGCHTGAHSLGRMDNEHRGERNYPGNSAAEPPNFCLDCHPRGG